MLVLQRLIGETIVISFADMSDADASDLISGRAVIEVTLTDIRSTDKAKIGIDAPVSVRIDRKEIHDAIQRDKREAAAARK